MLLALAALMLVSTLGVGLLRSATNRSMASRHTLDEAHAAVIAERVEHNIVHWLRNDTSAMRGALRPGWTLLHEHRSGLFAVRVHAIDLSGRLHHDMFRTDACAGLPSVLQPNLLLETPAPARSPRSNNPMPEAPLLEQRVNLPVTESESSWRWFPRRGDIQSETQAVVVSHWITVHGVGALNILTAPVTLLDAALQGHGVDAADHELLLALRQEERSIPAGLAERIVAGRRHSGRNPRAVPLTAQSDAIGVVVTVDHNGTERSTWIVFEHRAASAMSRRGGDARSSPWRTVERRRIPT